MSVCRHLEQYFVRTIPILGYPSIKQKNFGDFFEKKDIFGLSVISDGVCTDEFSAI